MLAIPTLMQALIQEYYFGEPLPFSDADIEEALLSDGALEGIVAFLKDRNHFGFLLYLSIYVRRFLEQSLFRLDEHWKAEDAGGPDAAERLKQARRQDDFADRAGAAAGVSAGGATLLAENALSQIASNSAAYLVSAPIDGGLIFGLASLASLFWMYRRRYSHAAQELRDCVTAKSDTQAAVLAMRVATLDRYQRTIEDYEASFEPLIFKTTSAGDLQ